MKTSTFNQSCLGSSTSSAVEAAVVDPQLHLPATDAAGRGSEVCTWQHMQAPTTFKVEGEQHCEDHENAAEAAWLPTGGLVTCARDMAMWLRFLLEASSGHPASGAARDRRIIQEVLRPRVAADWQLIFGVKSPGGSAFPEFSGVQYGLGVQVFSYRCDNRFAQRCRLTLRRGIPIACHTGSVPGTGALLLWTPGRTKGDIFGVYVNTNVMVQGLAVALIVALRVFDLEFGFEPIDWSQR